MTDYTGIWSLLLEAYRALVSGRYERAAQAANGDGAKVRFAGRVVVLPLHGLLLEHSDSFGFGTSTRDFGAAFQAAVDSSAVRAVVLHVDSPGGEVKGTPELTERIFAARSSGKPIIAIANSLAASAAYWIVSAAQRVYMTPSADVGSIGVFAIHEDLSGAMERDGAKVSFIQSKNAPFKTEGNPFEALTGAARRHLQQRVDAIEGEFIRDVARNRGVSEGTVTSAFGQGRVMRARRALSVGAVDGIKTLDDVLSDLGVTPQQRSRGRTVAERRAALEALLN